MHNSHLHRHSLKLWVGHITQFVLLWSLLLCVVLSLFLLHGAWLWLRGIQYTSPSTFIRVWATEVSVDGSGNRAAMRVTFKQNSGRDGTWSDIVLFDLQQRDAVCLGVRQYQPQCVAVNAQASVVAFGCADGSIYSVSGPFSAGPTARPAVKRVIARAHARDTGLSRIEFSPDGKHLAAVGNHFASVWQWPDGRFVRCRQHAGEPNTVLDFSADSQRILSLGASGELCYWDIETGNCVASITAQKGEVLSAVLIQRPRAVAFLTSSQVRVHSLDNNAMLWTELTASAGCAGNRGRPTRHGGASRPGRHRHFGHGDGATTPESGRPRCRDRRGPIRKSRCAVLVGLFRRVSRWDVAQQKQVWSFSLLQWASG